MMISPKRAASLHLCTGLLDLQLPNSIESPFFGFSFWPLRPPFSAAPRN